MRLKAKLLTLLFLFWTAPAFAAGNEIADYAKVIYSCDPSAMLLAQFTHGIVFFEIAYRDDGPPLGRFNVFVKSLDDVKTCEDASRAFDALLKLWESVGVNFQKEYIESNDGRFQLDRLAQRLKVQFQR
jgi:hypothetical protein